MKFWKRFNYWIITGMVGAGLTIMAVPAWSDTVDRIVAKVDSQIITQSELEERVFLKMMTLRKMNIKNMPSKAQVSYDELENMIDEKLLLALGKKRGYKVDDQRVDKAIKDIEVNNGLKEGDLERMLKAESKSLDEYKEKIRDQILMSDVRTYEIRKRVAVSDKEVLDFYNENIKKFWLPGKLKLRHILFLLGDELSDEDKRFKREKAKIALKKIRSGEDFISVARKFSEDISAQSGGDLGEIERGKMLPEFEKAAFTLKEGEVSGLVETPYGLHIIKVDKIVRGRTLTFDEVKDKIKNKLMQEKIVVEYKAFLKELRENSFIENKLTPPKSTVVARADNISPIESLDSSSGNIEKVEGNPFGNNNDSNRSNAHRSPFSKYQNFEKKLRHYKNLRDRKEISEEDYLRMKKELLSQL